MHFLIATVQDLEQRPLKNATAIPRCGFLEDEPSNARDEAKNRMIETGLGSGSLSTIIFQEKSA